MNKQLLCFAFLAPLCWVACSSAQKLECGEGTEKLGNLCVVSCADSERREGQRCVSRCDDSARWFEGDCRTGAQAITLLYSRHRPRLCACEDVDCEKRVDAELTAALAAAGQTFSVQQLGEIGPEEEAAMRAYEGCRPRRSLLAEFNQLAEDMCECSDSTCAEAVNKRFEAWIKRHEDAKPTDDSERERAMKIAETFTKCMMEAMTKTP